MQELKHNNKYEVLTPSGWSDFTSVKKKIHNHTILIKFDDGSHIQCTENHLIKIYEKFIEAQWIGIGQKINSKTVVSIDHCYGQIEVYDLTDVELDNEYYTNGIVSHNCEFIGSSGTLIAGSILKTLAFVQPIHSGDSGIKIYEQPNKNRTYVLIADTSRGKGMDYSAIAVIDCTDMPYKLVATFRDNQISPLVFPSIIKKLGDYYNSANALIEINDIGQQVLDILFDEYEYENILSTAEVKGRITVSFGQGNRVSRGLRTTKSVKRSGCSMLKSLIENQKLIIQDFDVIFELSTFISKNNSYEADAGYHDDLVMCLVLFSWLAGQSAFTDMTSTNIRSKIYGDRLQQIDDESLPMPIISDDSLETEYVQDGSVWKVSEFYRNN